MIGRTHGRSSSPRPCGTAARYLRVGVDGDAGVTSRFGMEGSTGERASVAPRHKAAARCGGGKQAATRPADSSLCLRCCRRSPCGRPSCRRPRARRRGGCGPLQRTAQISRPERRGRVRRRVGAERTGGSVCNSRCVGECGSGKRRVVMLLLLLFACRGIPRWRREGARDSGARHDGIAAWRRALRRARTPRGDPAKVGRCAAVDCRTKLAGARADCRRGWLLRLVRESGGPTSREGERRGRAAKRRRAAACSKGRRAQAAANTGALTHASRLRGDDSLAAAITDTRDRTADAHQSAVDLVCSRLEVAKLAHVQRRALKRRGGRRWRRRKMRRVGARGCARVLGRGGDLAHVALGVAARQVDGQAHPTCARWRHDEPQQTSGAKCGRNDGR